MTMRAIWTDEYGAEVSLSRITREGIEMDKDQLVLAITESSTQEFIMKPEDAESFAAYLRAWALKQREGE